MAVTLEQLRSDFQIYARKCLQIQPKKGGMVPLEINNVQLSILKAINEQRAKNVPPRIVVLKARRMGVSTFAQAIQFWDCHMNAHRTALTLAYDLELAKELFDKSRMFYEKLPAVVRPKKKLDSKTSIRFADTMSWLKVAVAGKRAGRGYGAQTVLISELAHMANPKETLDAVLQACAEIRDSLVIVESTPNGMGNEFYNLWVSAKRRESDWVPLFFPWFDDPTYVRRARFSVGDLDEDERDLVSRFNLSLNQLAWRRWIIENNFRGDVEMFLQEYPTDDKTCFLVSGRKVFDLGLPHYIELTSPEYLADHPLPPACEIESDPKNPGSPLILPNTAGRLRIFNPPKGRHFYVAGADCASGDRGGDYTPIVIVNQHTLDVDAVWFGKAPPERQAVYAMMLAAYYNNAKLNWEANNHGLGFGLAVEGTYPHVYWRKQLDSGTGKIVEKVGFLTTPSNRNYLIDLVRQYVRDQLGSILDPELVRQMSIMFYDDDRADHPDGDHDDLVFALAMALVAHQGSPDQPLAPLPLPDASTALEAYRQARLMGVDPEKMPDVVRLGLTCDDLQAIDDEDTRRKDREEGFLAMRAET